MTDNAFFNNLSSLLQTSMLEKTVIFFWPFIKPVITTSFHCNQNCAKHFYYLIFWCEFFSVKARYPMPLDHRGDTSLEADNFFVHWLELFIASKFHYHSQEVVWFTELYLNLEIWSPDKCTNKISAQQFQNLETYRFSQCLQFLFWNLKSIFWMMKCRLFLVISKYFKVNT